MLLFIAFSLIAVVAAIGVVTSRRPIYSALFLLLNFATLAALYVMLQAQFLAMVQIIVYAGAIVVLFLFVVMLIGGGEFSDSRDESPASTGETSKTPRQRLLNWPRLMAIALSALLLAGLVYGLVAGQLSQAAQGNRAEFAQGSVEALGGVLYTEYLLPFELTSVLLLVGMVGAVALVARLPES